MWFGAEELAAASEVVLGRGGQRPDAGRGPLASSPGAAALLEQLETAGICLAKLPGWPDAGPEGAGLGQTFAALLGELRPGDVVLWTGRGRGVGRTTLLAQLADGLALREAGGSTPASPVVWVGEHTPGQIRARSLARYCGLALATFVDPGHARRRPELASAVEAFERSAWARLDARQRFVVAGRDEDDEKTAPLSPLSPSAGWLSSLRSWLAEHGEGAPRWPVLILDPLESLVGPQTGLDAAIAAVAALAAREQLIVLASADAREDPGLTRRIDRHLHARIRVGPGREGETLELELRHGRLGRRGRARLRWTAACGRLRDGEDGPTR